jgi:hypothetical protein
MAILFERIASERDPVKFQKWVVKLNELLSLNENRFNKAEPLAQVTR